MDFGTLLVARGIPKTGPLFGSDRFAYKRDLNECGNDRHDNAS